MKQIVNTKKLLKATIALSGIVLAGCAASNDDEWNNTYIYNEPQAVENSVVYTEPENNIPVVEETMFEEIVIVEEKTQQPCEKEAPVVLTQTTVSRSVAASSPAEPRVVPVKPADKYVSCKTATTKKKTTTTTEQVTVKHKPQAAPTPAEEVVVTQVTVAQSTVPVPQEKPAVQEEVTAVEIEDDTAKLEAERLAKEEADRLAAQEAAQKAAEELAAQEAAKKAAEEAERARLQKEMEKLEAEKKALEEEKIRISQIERNNTESCEDVKDWVAAEGSTLRSLLMEWGDRVGWRVVWNMDRDYTLQAGAVFRGRFVDVAAALLRSFARATPAPKGVFYKGNKVLVISTREDENAD